MPAAVLLHGKGSKDRVLPLGEVVLVELERYGLPRSGPVFPRRDGHPGHNTSTRVSNIVHKHLRAVGVPFTLHQCRHRFATAIYRQSKDLRMTQELLGHSSPTTTAIYAQFDTAAAAGALNLLSQTLN